MVHWTSKLEIKEMSAEIKGRGAEDGWTNADLLMEEAYMEGNDAVGGAADFLSVSTSC